MGVIGTLTQGAYIKGMEAGEAAVMAPIDYTRLVFAVGAGLLLFHEAPSPAVLIGAAIVVASTLFISLARAPAVAAGCSSAGVDSAPFDEARQALGQPDLGLVATERVELVDVGEGRGDVAGLHRHADLDASMPSAVSSVEIISISPTGSLSPML
jgi:hypothetical protein